MHMTATRNHSGQTVYNAGVCRLVHKSDLLQFIHGLPLIAVVLLIIVIKKQILSRFTNIGQLCMCSSVSTNQSLQKTFHENS